VNSLKADINISQREVLQASLEDESRQAIREKHAGLNTLQAELKSLEYLKGHLSLDSALNGKIYFIDENVSIGQSVKKDYVWAKIADIDDLDFKAFVPENYISGLKVGARVIFESKNDGTKIKGVVKEISPMRGHELIYPQIASLNGGELPVVDEPGTKKSMLVESFYAVQIDLDNKGEKLRVGEVGYFDIEGNEVSYLSKFLKYIHTMIYRESSL
jgi:hypothetical protein